MIQDTVIAVLHWESLGGQQTSSVEQYTLDISYIYVLTNLRQKNVHLCLQRTQIPSA